MSEEPYVYIHILPVQTGESYHREIVPASCIRKFDYEHYKVDKQFYKDTCFKFKRSESETKLKCYILHAADSHFEVKQYVDSAAAKNKRFRKPNPKHVLSENDSTISTIPPIDVLPDDQTDEVEDEITISKSKRKAKKQLQKENDYNQAQRLINNYINASRLNDQENQFQADDADFEMESSQERVHQFSSTPLSEKTFQRTTDKDTVIKAYQTQVQFFKKQMEEWKNKYLKLEKETNRNNPSSQSKNNSADDDYSFMEYDRIYNLTLTQENKARNLDRDLSDEMIVVLRKNVVYNSLAYKHAYAATRPSDFISLISKGVYGKSDLSKRCVKKQKNTPNKEELDRVKTEVIEEEFYNYLRVKCYTLKQIERELEKLNRYHHNSISIARKQLAKELSENEINEGIEELRRQHDERINEEQLRKQHDKQLNAEQRPNSEVNVENNASHERSDETQIVT